MYWTVWGDVPALERAHLDGTNRKVLISHIGHAQDLTIDYLERRLYWTDVNNHTIMSSDMNGKLCYQYIICSSFLMFFRVTLLYLDWWGLGGGGEYACSLRQLVTYS